MSEYDTETQEYLRHGLTLMQASLIGGTEESTIRAIYDVFQLRDLAEIIDLGCGAGGLSIGFLKINPSLNITAVTNSGYQYELLRDIDRRIDVAMADMTNTGLTAGRFDGAVFAESLGYVDARSGLAEAHRLLRPGGVLVIKELCAKPNIALPEFMDLETKRGRWGYAFSDSEHIEAIGREIGFSVQSMTIPASFDRFMNFMRTSQYMMAKHGSETESLPLVTVLFRMVKRHG